MKLPEQKKGREHLAHIHEAAMALYGKTNFEGGCWFACLKQAMKDHREYLIKCVEERKRIEAESTKRCDDCGIELDADDIFHYVSICHSCYEARRDNDCSQRPGRRRHLNRPTMLGLCL